jgi:hypothetical protein
MYYDTYIALKLFCFKSTLRNDATSEDMDLSSLTRF